MKKVWYRKQPSRFGDINASPNRPAFFSDDFDYMTLFGDDMQRPKVFVVFLDENTPVFDVWKDSVEKLCGYPAPCVEFLLGDALETMTYCLDKFLEMIGDRPSAKAIRLALKKLDERYAPMADVAKAADAELLEFVEWAAEIVKKANAKGVPPYKVIMSDMIQAKSGIKGIIDGPGSLMSIDPNIQSSVAYTLSMREVNWLSDHRMDDMQSDDPARVSAAVEACRRRYGTPAQLKEDEEPLPVADLGSVLRLDGCGKQKDMCWGYDGFVLAHKDVNPEFDEGKPFMVVIDQDGVRQMHFENFGTAPKDEKVLDDMYRAVAASCEKGTELELRGGATPGGLSGFSKLRDYGFRKEPLSDDTPVYWGGELDQAKLEKWLNSGRHDDDFLVRTDGDVEPGVEGGVFVSPREYGGKITAGNTKPRPFKMVRESNDEVRLKYYCRSFDRSPIRMSESGRAVKSQERVFSESRNVVVPPEKWYSQITAEMVEEYWPARYIPSYFADVLNGTTPLDEARDDLLSFVPGYREDMDAGQRVDESASGRTVKSRERVFSESTADRQILRWAHMLDEAFGLNEESSAETRRRARIQKAKERLAANALNGEAEEKARIICGMPDLVDICRGKYKKFIVYHERVIVVARLNGNTHVPFYCSTGLAGKSASSAKAGRWFVFWGIGRDGWFNKMGLANDFDPDGGLCMHNQFGSKVLKAVADRLDAEVGDVAGIFADMPENAVTLEQARAAVNGCFKRDPIPWSSRHEPNSIIDYLNNMAGVFSGINDTAAVYRLILCGSMIGAEYFKGSSSETGFRLPQMRREKDSPPLSGNCRL